MNKLTFKLLLSTALGLMSASALFGDHEIVAQHTENLECQMKDLRTSFYEQFYYSANYRELRSVAWDVRNDARSIERMTRRDSPICDLREQINDAYACVEKLRLLVAEARYRADNGLDRPLAGCTLHIDAKLAEARQTLDCISAVIFTPAPPVVIATPVPGRSGWHATQRPGYQYNPGQQSPYAVPANTYPQGPSAPAWNPNYPGQYQPTLPRGNSFYEEIGPPITRQQFVPRSGTCGSPPAGVYGQRGNGIEMGNNGLVLRIGGAAIQIR
jgi:hypothetical protein